MPSAASSIAGDAPLPTSNSKHDATNPAQTEQQDEPLRRPLTSDALAAVNRQPYERVFLRHTQTKLDKHVRGWLDHSGNSEGVGPVKDTKLRPTKQAGLDQILVTTWGCKIEDSLPAKLKPRLKHSSGKKWSIDAPQDRRPVPASSWPKDFSKTLSRLARCSVGQQSKVHQLLEDRVLQRQTARVHPEYYAREVLTSDLKAVIDAFTRAEGDSRVARDTYATSSLTDMRPEEAYGEPMTEDMVTTTNARPSAITKPEGDLGFDGSDEDEEVDTLMRRIDASELRREAKNALVKSKN